MYHQQIAFRLLSVEKHIILFTKSVCIKNDCPSSVLISQSFTNSIASIRFFVRMRFLRSRCTYTLFAIVNIFIFNLRIF